MNVMLGDTFFCHFGTTSPSTGNATNADGTPVVTIEEDGTTLAYAATVVNSGVGLYRVQVDATSGNGFEANKRYSGWVAATVGGATGRDGLFEFWCNEHSIDVVEDNVEVVIAQGVSLLSDVAEVIGNQTSMYVAIRSTWSNTISIKTDTTSLAINVSSLLSNVNAINVLDTSMLVSVKSTLSNTQSIVVSEASLLSNVNASLVATASLLTNVGTIDGVVDASLVGIASLLSNIVALDVLIDSVIILVTSVLVDTGTSIPASIAALNNLSAAQVATEISDALHSDGSSEPGQLAPPLSAAIGTKIDFLYKWFRNRRAVTSTMIALYNDAGAVIDQKLTHSDDGVTYDRGEVGSGP